MKSVQKIGTACGCVLLAVFFIWGWKNEIFTDQDQLQQQLSGAGIFAPGLFVLIQIVQVIVPILPGGVSCLLGVLFFGKVQGFVYNYIGLCIGSWIVFELARGYGSGLVRQLIGDKSFERYSSYLTKEKHFHTFFAACIFMPCAPDDILCYIAGLSDMSRRMFVAIILLGKPWAILAYSMGLHMIFDKMIQIGGGR